MKKIAILIITIFSISSAFAENDDTGYDMPIVIENGEILPLEILTVPVVIHADYTSSQWRMIKDIKKTLPLARQIAAEQAKIEAECDGMDKKAKKEYMKVKEDEIVSKYKPIFDKMSARRGKVLIKLINREQDAYQVIKGYKGGFRAAMWQGVASVFGLSLHSKFNKTELNFVNSVVARIDANEL